MSMNQIELMIDSIMMNQLENMSWWIGLIIHLPQASQVKLLGGRSPCLNILWVFKVAFEAHVKPQSSHKNFFDSHLFFVILKKIWKVLLYSFSNSRFFRWIPHGQLILSRWKPTIGFLPGGFPFTVNTCANKGRRHYSKNIFWALWWGL